MSSDSENSIVVEDMKPQRRSSIFRPTLEPTHLNFTTTAFPSGYSTKLLDESMKWKEIYTAAKMEFNQLKSNTKKGETYPIKLPNLQFFEESLKKITDFCNQVNTISTVHELALKHKLRQCEQLEHQVAVYYQDLSKNLM